jgi:hypothetical protein
VAEAGRQDHDVSGLDIDLLALRTAEHERCRASRDRQHLECVGMEMVEIEDPPRPRAAPAVLPQQRLDGCVVLAAAERIARHDGRVPVVVRYLVAARHMQHPDIDHASGLRCQIRVCHDRS